MITKGLGKLNAVSYIETISTKNIKNNEIVKCLRSNYGMSNWDEGKPAWSTDQRNDRLVVG